MNLNEIRAKIKDGGFNEAFKMLYSNTDIASARYLKAVDEFQKLYGDSDNIRIFSAPGRTEVGGNHTDHQHGKVLAGSVDLDVIAIVAANDSGIVRIKSEGYPMDEICVDDLQINEGEYGKAAALIRGVCAAFKNNGYNIGGFDAYTTSNVLKGSGLSSSAAFEVLVSNIINGVYNDGKVDCVSIAKYSQFAEREYFGKPCGLLDQMASSVGGFTYADFNDPKNPVIEKIDLDLAKSGCTLCVVDTGGNHANLTGDYADITVECRSISNHFGMDFLRDVNPVDFFENISVLRCKYGDRAVLRALHFFNEDDRAEKEKLALKKGDFKEFLKLVNESGDSSFKYLQNVYSVSDVHEQGIALALALTEQYLKGTDKGAYRVHGGGFAGTIQVFMPNELLNGYKNTIEKAFGKGSCYVLNIRPVGGYELKK